MSKRVLIIGANSDIALSAGKMYLNKGCEVMFAAHKPEELPVWAVKKVKTDVRNIIETLDVLKNDSYDIVLYAAGKMATNEECLNPAVAAEIRAINFDAPTTLLAYFAEQMRAQGKGVLVGISSVAADRGKSSHHLYGASKAGFDSFLAGLRQDLNGTGVRVLTIRPGYVATKMTAGMDLPKLLMASKEQVAQKIVRNSLAGNRNVIYVKSIWRPLMWILRHIPEVIFKRKKL